MSRVVALLSWQQLQQNVLLILFIILRLWVHLSLHMEGTTQRRRRTLGLTYIPQLFGSIVAQPSF